MRLAGIAVLLAACGGGGAAPAIDASGVPDAIPPIVCRGASDSDLVQVTPITAVPFSASVGERLAAPLTVRVHSGDLGIVGCTIAWGAGANNGWIFPLSPVTGDDGVASAWWIPGTDPSEIAFSGAGDSASVQGAAPQRRRNESSRTTINNAACRSGIHLRPAALCLRCPHPWARHCASNR